MYFASLDTAGLERQSEDSVEGGRAAAAELLEAGATGIVCASDTLAIGVLHELASRGLRPGADIGVVGFDDSQAAQVFPGGLTSVRQPLEDVAVEIVHAVERLLSPMRPASWGGCCPRRWRCAARPSADALAAVERTPVRSTPGEPGA